MSRAKNPHRCLACGQAFAKWSGRCPACAEWNSLVEEPPPAGGTTPPYGPPSVPLQLREVDLVGAEAVPTGLGELDRVLGGGLVPGSATVLGGEPGVGKSTLVLQALASLAAGGATSLLVAAEESAGQVARRAARLGAAVEGCHVLAATDLDTVLAATAELGPAVLVVDSIQAVADPTTGSAAGSPSQVRQCAGRLVRLAKQTGVATVLVGHVTKDGALAGPRTLEHLVDTVLSFDGDRHHRLRALTASKHRFGPTGEIGLFEMTGSGLSDLEDPSALLLSHRCRELPGSVGFPSVEGRRPLTLEVQGLVGPPGSPAPRRVAQGLVPGRLALLLAVLERRCGLGLSGCDVFVSTAGGIRVGEPAADLAMGLALVSAATGVPLGDDVVAFGEVGLSGELRPVPASELRIGEAARLGFRRAVVPRHSPDVPTALEVLRAGTLEEAIRLMLGPARAGGTVRGPGGGAAELSGGAEVRTLVMTSPSLVS